MWGLGVLVRLVLRLKAGQWSARIRDHPSAGSELRVRVKSACETEYSERRERDDSNIDGVLAGVACEG